MTADARRIADQAIAWHVRARDMGETDWQAFVLWLEADPAHAAAYDRVALADRLLPDAEVASPANDPGKPFERRRFWPRAAFGGGAAAALLAVLFYPHAAPYQIVTKAGERRTVVLSDTTRIEMNGGTTLELDRNNPRLAALAGGEAVFHVRHDADTPFRLRSGDALIEDAGTVFNAARTGPRLDVQVAEGAVRYDPDRQAILVRAGSGLSARDDRGRVEVAAVAPASVGGWRAGRLTFSGEPMAYVAAAVSRQSGAQLVLAPELSARPFTGIVNLTGDAKRDVPHIAALAGAAWRRDGERWVLAPI